MVEVIWKTGWSNQYLLSIVDIKIQVSSKKKVVMMQVFDCNDGTDVYDYIHRIFNGACDKWKALYGEDVPFEKLPTDEDVKYIAALLRGDFDKAVAISVQIKYAEEELIKLTNEQYRCVDQLDDNKRCLIEGGAGTGKTLLAIEEAKKAVASGLRVALFCYNKNLGDWFEKYFEDVPGYF